MPGRLGPQQQVLVGVVGQVDHRHVEPAPQLFAHLDAADSPIEPDINQGQVGTAASSFFKSPAPARDRCARRVSHVSQGFLQARAVCFLFLDDQDLRAAHLFTAHLSDNHLNALLSATIPYTPFP